MNDPEELACQYKGKKAEAHVLKCSPGPKNPCPDLRDPWPLHRHSQSRSPDEMYALLFIPGIS